MSSTVAETSPRAVRARAFAFAFGLLLVVPTQAPAASAIEADRPVLVIDTSGSMGNLGNHGMALQAVYESIRRERPSGADSVRFGLVLYEEMAAMQTFDGATVGSLDQLNELLGSGEFEGSGDEDGYHALAEARKTFPDSKLFMLFTDEDRDVVHSRDSLQGLADDFRINDVTLDVLVSVGFVCPDGRVAIGMTAAKQGLVLNKRGLVRCESAKPFVRTTDAETAIPDYVELAHLTGGTAWDIEVFEADGQRRRSAARRTIGLPRRPDPERAALAPAVGRFMREQALERHPPSLVVIAKAFPATVSVGDIVTLDASGSHAVDDADYTVAWRWDFDGDGVYDGWDAVVATSFDQPGAKTVQVEVTDNQGAVERAEVTVQVE